MCFPNLSATFDSESTMSLFVCSLLTTELSLFEKTSIKQGNKVNDVRNNDVRPMTII